MSKFVYFFGKDVTDGKSSMKDLLGGKGANLAEMANLGVPVPPGFTISTEVCVLYLKEGKYQFLVNTRDVYGRISKPASFSFEISPPWYRKTIFYITAGLVILGLLYLGYFYFQWRIKLVVELEKQKPDLMLLACAEVK